MFCAYSKNNVNDYLLTTVLHLNCYFYNITFISILTFAFLKYYPGTSGITFSIDTKFDLIC